MAGHKNLYNQPVIKILDSSELILSSGGLIHPVKTDDKPVKPVSVPNNSIKIIFREQPYLSKSF